MEYKSKNITIGNPRGNGFPFKFKIHWDDYLKEYVLSQGLFFKSHFSLEEIEDMKRALIKWNKNLKNDI